MHKLLAQKRVNLFGITFHNVTMAEAVEAIRHFADGETKHFVTTPNVDHIVRLRKDREFREAYEKASLVLADGAPVIWASRLLSRPIKERVAGSDLLIPVCQRAAEKGHSVYFLGGQVGVAEKAIVRLKESFPSLQVAGHYAPPFGFENDVNENRKIVHQINQAKPHLLFIALGAPKQEKWVVRHLHELEIKVALCIGAGVDFIAGTAKRAPQWMRNISLEWLWRLLHEPKRLWRRYLIHDAAFPGMFLKEWLHLHWGKGTAPK